MKIVKQLRNIVFITILTSCTHSSKNTYIINQGEVFGTYYHFNYRQAKGKDYQQDLEALLHQFDNSLSTYNPQSILARINENDTTVRVDSFFIQMYQTAKKVSQVTSGAFDITVSPLVAAWGFGAKHNASHQLPNIDSIMPNIGFRKITLQGKRLLKTSPQIRLDASAIAKGQAVDVVATWLTAHDCTDFMVEIGGEIACKGRNPHGEIWQIGIDKPFDDPANENTEIQQIISLQEAAIATSGNYRQYYYDTDSNKIVHTIDPRTGYPADSKVVSASVIAPTCILADAYATAFMVLGVDSSLQIANADSTLSCMLISRDCEGAFYVAKSIGFGNNIKTRKERTKR